jgi:hypothetical protein
MISGVGVYMKERETDLAKTSCFTDSCISRICSVDGRDM